MVLAFVHKVYMMRGANNGHSVKIMPCLAAALGRL